MQPTIGGHESKTEDIIDEKSIEDKLLSSLAIIALAALLSLGYYWQSLSLPPVVAEEEPGKK